MDSCLIFFFFFNVWPKKTNGGLQGISNSKALHVLYEIQVCTAATPISGPFSLSHQLSLSHLPTSCPLLTLSNLISCWPVFLTEPALCQCVRLIQSLVHRHSNVMTHDIQLMLFQLLGGWVSSNFMSMCAFVLCSCANHWMGVRMYSVKKSVLALLEHMTMVISEPLPEPEPNNKNR